jgi:hypothetical protein
MGVKTAAGVTGQRRVLLINFKGIKSADFSTDLHSASKGSGRGKTTEAVENGMGGRIWKQIPIPGRGKTSRDKVEDGTRFKTEPRGKVVHQGTQAR